MSGFTHFDDEGRAFMVDVSDKSETERIAVAMGTVFMEPSTLALIQEGGVKKGDVLSVARLAGIMGAKKTPDLIPLCHPLMLTSIKVELLPDWDNNAIIINTLCKVSGQTGVEMEALCAASVAGLTIYDMCKAIDKAMIVSDIQLETKSGGKSGDWKRDNL